MSPSRGDKLLSKAKRSPHGWRKAAIHRLYRAYGFEIRNGSKHDIVSHPDYPDLRATITRDNDLASGYATKAVDLIETLLSRQVEEPAQEEVRDE